MNPVRTIWLDGRKHPSPNAPHTWEGFSTGVWDGDTLVVKTTHLKEGWVRRNGIPRSANGKLTEFLIRHDNCADLGECARRSCLSHRALCAQLELGVGAGLDQPIYLRRAPSAECRRF